MIRHIVMWKFREGTEEKANEFLTKLAALDGVIPQLKKCEVAKNIGKDNYDAVLVSEFETMDDLNAYKVDPRHAQHLFTPIAPIIQIGVNGVSTRNQRDCYYYISPVTCISSQK